MVSHLHSRVRSEESVASEEASLKEYDDCDHWMHGGDRQDLKGGELEFETWSYATCERPFEAQKHTVTAPKFPANYAGASLSSRVSAVIAAS